MYVCMCVCVYVCMYVCAVCICQSGESARSAQRRTMFVTSAAAAQVLLHHPHRRYTAVRVRAVRHTPFPLCIYVTIWQVRHRVADSVSHEQLHPPQPTRRHAGYVMQH